MGDMYQLPGAPPTPKAAPGFALPAWMDGGFVQAASSLVISDPIVIAFGAIARFPSNPRRWAIGFLSAPGTPSGLAVSPFPRPDLFSLAQIGNANPLWYTIFEYGPFVTGELYLYSSAGITIRVAEVEV